MMTPSVSAKDHRTTRTSLFTALLGVFLLLLPVITFSAQPDQEEVVVTANKTETNFTDLIGNTDSLSTERIQLINPQHIYELGTQTSGVWLSRGSGQESLPAIRSQVFTGPGACGNFLFMENGIPSRPTGFCNVNELFELPNELADSIEIIRGPSNALYGSNGLHGVINILLPTPTNEPRWDIGATLGPDDFVRGKANWSGAIGQSALAAGGLVDHYDGFRDDTGYDQQKGYLRLTRELDGNSGTLDTFFSAQHLDQDTGGYILGEDAYKDKAVRTTNPNPEAFRKADSQRLSTSWTSAPDSSGISNEARFYLRNSDMKFLMHFLPGQPLEKNGQTSGGVLLTQFRPIGNASLTTGFDFEYMDGYIKQFQAEPTDSGSAFLDEVLPQGAQYDFDVNSIMAASYAQIEVPVQENWQLVAGLRLEYLYYNYDNNLLDGNTRDDGTDCGFGGCRYNRPADRDDDFLNIAPNIGARYRLTNNTALYATLMRGFRAPQVTELYRLQNNQTVADLDSVEMDSLEIGIHSESDNYRIEASGFAMRKKNDIFQDANRTNISNGKTKHVGVEIQGIAQADSGLYAGLAGTWAKHTYDFDATTVGDSITSGDDIDTAPRTLGSVRVGWELERGLIEVEGLHQGSYYLDAANERKYNGHNLLNLRSQWQVSDNWQVAARLNNVTDELYADRADFAFGNYRYFPGRTREFFIELTWFSR